MLVLLLFIENIENINKLVQRKNRLVFLNEDAERKPKRLPFHFEGKETLIDFFKINPSLWNHSQNKH